MRTRTRATAALTAAVPLAALAALACARQRPGHAAATGGRCTGQPYVEVENPLPDRAYVQFFTASGRAFLVDFPLQPKELRRIETPRDERVVRAFASTEAWRVERPGRPAVQRSTGTRVPIRTGCAAA
jgi:hypothetical protein